jgi:peptidoglycan/LPS O-acetylase OafA/YrhL
MKTTPALNHFWALDSFRGLCACFVALSHFHANSFFYGSPVLDRGGIYVDFFFVLSGFVIFANYSEKLKENFGIGKFVFLRLGRLYPLHFVMFLTFIILELVQVFVSADMGAIYPPFQGPGESIEAMAANVFLVHSLGILDRFAFNGPSWSISVEFFAYILFAFILVYTKRYSNYIIGICLFASLSILFIYHGHLYAKLDYGFFRCVYGFSFGVFVWEIYNKIGHKFRPIIQNNATANLCEIGLLILTVLYIQFFSYGTTSFLAPLIFSFVVFLFAFEGGVCSRILKNKLFLLLGTLSYSIYMTHVFIAGKFFALPIRLLENRMGWDISTTIEGETVYGTTILLGTYLELFYLFTVVCCSYISFKLIEDPCRKLSKRIAHKINI